jgi:hypothetical protein
LARLRLAPLSTGVPRAAAAGSTDERDLMLVRP